MRIGFIGLGGMGLPMAGHLLAAGHQLTLWSRRPDAGGELLALGAQRAASPQALAAASDIVCSNVTGSTDVLGLAAQLIDGFTPDSIHLDFSTIAPTTARELAARYVARGRHFVDAPVSGGTAGARAASLAIMWGGAAALGERLEPIFTCLGKTVVRIGEAGAGQVAKICNQLVMVAAIEASAEAAHLAAAAGVDFARVRAALLGGSASSRVLDFFGGKMVAGDFVPGVEARLHHKDFVMAMAEATQTAAPLPVGGVVMQQLDALMAAGWGHDDSSRLLSVLARSTGKNA
jgi:2-hydroxy-3-oxopropionate reductase